MAKESIKNKFMWTRKKVIVSQDYLKINLYHLPAILPLPGFEQSARVQQKRQSLQYFVSLLNHGSYLSPNI
jgi:hypothetical protein